MRFYASMGCIKEKNICGPMGAAVEPRFGGLNRTSADLERLSDNGICQFSSHHAVVHDRAPGHSELSCSQFTGGLPGLCLKSRVCARSERKYA